MLQPISTEYLHVWSSWAEAPWLGFFGSANQIQRCAAGAGPISSPSALITTTPS